MKITIDTQELLDRMLLQSSYEDLDDGWTNNLVDSLEQLYSVETAVAQEYAKYLRAIKNLTK